MAMQAKQPLIRLDAASFHSAHWLEPMIELVPCRARSRHQRAEPFSGPLYDKSPGGPSVGVVRPGPWGSGNKQVLRMHDRKREEGGAGSPGQHAVLFRLRNRRS